MLDADPDNPLHRAGFYVESLKYGPGPRTIERVSRDQFREQFDILMADADREGVLTFDQFVEAITYYGATSASAFGVQEIFSRSIFTDGFMHGFALAAGCSLTIEQLEALEREERGDDGA